MSGRRIFFFTVNFVCWLLLTSYSVSDPPPCYHSGTLKSPVILPKVQVAGYTWTSIRHWPNEVGVNWLCHCPGIVLEPIRKQAHTQLVREHSTTVVSAWWATVDWSWSKEWNWCARANLHFKPPKKCKYGMNGWTLSPNPSKWGKSHHHHQAQSTCIQSTLLRKLKGTTSKAASLPENRQNVEMFPFADSMWLFYQYLCNRVAFFPSKFSSPGCSCVGSLLTI